MQSRPPPPDHSGLPFSRTPVSDSGVRPEISEAIIKDPKQQSSRRIQPHCSSIWRHNGYTDLAILTCAVFEPGASVSPRLLQQRAHILHSHPCTRDNARRQTFRRVSRGVSDCTCVQKKAPWLELECAGARAQLARRKRAETQGRSHTHTHTHCTYTGMRDHAAQAPT